VGRLLRAAESFLAEEPDFAGLFWRVDIMAVTLAPSGAVSRLTHVIDALQSG
jgi:Holliday junction resolvase-like predicted endonuclease